MHDISALELIGRLVLAVVLCGLIGAERESRDQAAGLRTHVLVGLGSALFTLVSAYAFLDFYRRGGNFSARPDPTRIAAQIVSGIGFLGAGAIIRQGLSIRGLTTAAALWISAAIGMAAGAGYYLGAVATTGISLLALVGLRWLRPFLLESVRRDFVLLELELHSPGAMAEVLTLLAEREVRVEGVNSTLENGNEFATLELQVPPGVDVEETVGRIAALESVDEVSASGARFGEGWSSR
jgi:putative Mg2+ transporter-C (MgtC) family protein